jgi:hypothetical protein
MNVAKFNITIWKDGTLKGMKEISSDLFFYTELSKTHAGYQGIDTVDEELSNYVRRKCDKVLTELDDMLEGLESVEFLGKMNNHSYLGKSVSDLTEDQQAKLFKTLNSIISSDKITISSEEDIVYILTSKTLNLPPMTYVELVDRLRAYGLKYKLR